MTTQEYINKLKFIVATFEECLMRGEFIDNEGYCVECEGPEGKCHNFCRINRAQVVLKELKEERI